MNKKLEELKLMAKKRSSNINLKKTPTKRMLEIMDENAKDLYFAQFETIEEDESRKIDLYEFLKKTGKEISEVDSQGNMIVNRDDPNRNRWLED